MQDDLSMWLEYAWYAVGAALTLFWLLRRIKGSSAFADALARSHTLRASDIFLLAIVFLTVQFLYAQYAAGAIADKNWTVLDRANLGLAAGQIFFVLLAIGIASRRFEQGLKTFGLSFQNFPKLLALAVLYFVVAAGMTFLTLYITSFFLEHFGREVEKHEFLNLIEQKPPLSTLVLLVLLPAVIAPITEEILFRGFLQTYFIKLFGSRSKTSLLTDWEGVPFASPLAEKPDDQTRWLAIFVTSVLFSAMHPMHHWPALFVLSFFLGYAYEKKASLIPPILIHIFFNTLSVTAALL